MVATVMALAAFRQMRSLGLTFGESIWPVAGRWLLMTEVPGLFVIQLKHDTEKWRSKREEES